MQQLRLLPGYSICCFIVLALHLTSRAQCPGKAIRASDLLQLEANKSYTDTRKLDILYTWKKQLETCNAPKDSVYATTLEKIGRYEYLVNRDYDAAIRYTQQALVINGSGKKQGAEIYAIKNFYDIGHYYDEMFLFSNALAYYDTTILFANKFPPAKNLLLDARLYKAYIFFRSGDYQKGIEESVLGMQSCTGKHDSLYYLRFLNQKAQSLFFQNELTAALNDVNAAKRLAQSLDEPFQLASAFKMEGYIYAKQRKFTNAEEAFKNSIKNRLQTTNKGQVAGDYNDLGNFYRDSLRSYSDARQSFFTALKYAAQVHDSIRLARINLNLSRSFFDEKNFAAAATHHLIAEKFLRININNDITRSAPAEKINLIGNKELVLALFSSKTELLLNLYHKTKVQAYLDASLPAALLFDSIITEARHKQLGEQSKLYWRNRTKDFFANALKACYLANKPELAFFFMEKSRSVLLNDKLNELGAAAQLPAAEAARQQQFNLHLISAQQQLSSLSDSSVEFKKEQQAYYRVKEEFEQYINSLEKKYPAYYQYKYDDKVPSFRDLKQYLASNNQSFVHYFINDTVAYMLGIMPAATKFIRLSKSQFDSNKLRTFLQLCANRDSVNNDYISFVSRSHKLYKILFEPLQVPKGRVIICPDNFLIPFEVLCTDETAKNFLVKDYAFSYVYSARYLVKKLTTKKAEGNFVGFSPVSFQPYLHMAQLTQSSSALEKCAAYYSGGKLYTNKNASRANFLNSITRFNIVNIFSHASAGTAATEPFLLMQDSIIKLSELQVLQNNAINLVILSACETNVGKNAPGEGIYSLARGFSAAGIPSVAATLWNADDLSIYFISEKFHAYLSKGLHKDEALQKAKLDFMQNSDRERLLPYYWANMVLVGNTEPVEMLDKQISSGTPVLKWAIIISLVLLIVFIMVFRKKKAASR